MQRTKRTAIGGAIAILLLAALVSLAAAGRSLAAPRAAQAGAHIVGNFTATVYYGPDKGLTLAGVLQLAEDKTGRLTGQLAPATGPGVRVTGQLNGRAVNLVFYLGHSRYVFGVGTFGQDSATKGWVVGGPLVGPNKGDSGEWTICLICEDTGSQLICQKIPCPNTQ